MKITNPNPGDETTGVSFAGVFIPYGEEFDPADDDRFNTVPDDQIDSMQKHFERLGFMGAEAKARATQVRRNRYAQVQPTSTQVPLPEFQDADPNQLTADGMPEQTQRVGVDAILPPPPAADDVDQGAKEGSPAAVTAKAAKDAAAANKPRGS